MSKAKGRRTTYKALDKLTEEGWIYDQVELGGRFRKYKDFLAGYCLTCWKREDGCCDKQNIFEGFDVVAIKFPVIKLLQIKTNQPVTQKNYKLFARRFASKTIEVQCWTWYDRKGWVEHHFLPNGKVKRIDLRK